MVKLLKLLVITSAAIGASFSHASVKSMGTNYRVLLSNYAMINHLKKQCDAITYPDLPTLTQAERMMQGKLGIEFFVQASIAIQRSDLKKNAEETIDRLMENVEDCNDPKVARALTKIEISHIQAYARVKDEPALVPPKAVPVPLKPRN